MAASRKLQAEIDRCLKKVSEGVELFEEVWTKVHNATNPNQKEKYESDLKKEIKKLQRLRDQIKTWIASGEIKDKSTLVDTRKLIETQMERFKVVERETKTKAYSKEGLGLVTKADPITKERDELNTWLINTIDNMQMQIDSFESDIESLLVFKKKKLDKEKQEKLDMFKRVVEKHKFHVGKLEVILRTLDNIANEEKLPIFLSQVRKIKEDVDYYLDSAQDPEYEDNEFLYDDIECLDDLLGSGVGSSTISPTPTPGLDTNPSTPTPSAGRVSPSFQALTIERQQVEYLRQPELLQQHQYEPQQHHGFPERRRSYTEESTSAAAKIFKPLPVKAAYSGSVGVGSYGTKVHSPMNLGSNNNVSSFVQNSIETPEPTVIEPQRQVVYERKISNDAPSMMESGDSGPTPNNVNLFGSSEMESNSKPVRRPPPLLPPETRYIKPVRVHTPTPPPFQPVNVPPPNEPLPDVGYPSNGLTHTHYQPQRPTSLELRDTPHLEKEQEGLNDSQVLPNSHNMSNSNHLSASTSPGVSMTGSSAVVVVHPKAVRSEPLVVRTEPEPTPSYTPQLLEEEPENLPAQSHVEEELHLEEDLPLPPQQTQQQHPAVNNAPHMSHTPSHEQMLIDQYISSSESNPMDSHLTTLKSMAQEVMTRAGLNFTADQRPASEETSCAHIPPLLGVAPLGPVPLQQKHDYQLAMLESAHYHMPIPADSEPLRQYLPRNPMQTPSYYPQSPLLNSDSLDFFGRLSIETLFFIFYYLEGTRAQYMAAKVLKKQSWRFHTKFMMWFQRHEEPKVINEVYEQGTYIYFDIEKWGQRKKDGFVFEYQYLEDRDLN